MNEQKILPIFFAVDENYAPFLSTTIASILDNASKDYFYRFHVLHKNLRQEDMERIKKYENENCEIIYNDVAKELSKIESCLHTRDYYTKTTYFRLFIEPMFPQYDKALYLDSDIIVLGDISELFNKDVSNHLVAAIVEDVMNNVDVFGTYVEKTLGINRETYFNAGVLLMNLKKFREVKLLDQFFDLLQKFTFVVTQDEDYLNVLCKDQVLWVEQGWNAAPIPNTEIPLPDLKLIHYKMTMKPWKYDDVLYQEHFFKYSDSSPYCQDFVDMKNSYTQENIDRDNFEYEKLVKQALSDIADENNYHNTMMRNLVTV